MVDFYPSTCYARDETNIGELHHSDSIEREFVHLFSIDFRCFCLLVSTCTEFDAQTWVHSHTGQCHRSKLMLAYIWRSVFDVRCNFRAIAYY